MSDQDSSLFSDIDADSGSDSGSDSGNDANDNVAASSSNDDDEEKKARLDALLDSFSSIPPIVDILISNLAYQERLVCLHVCKLWNRITQGYLWQHVSFHNATTENGEPVPLTPAKVTTIRRGAGRITSLAVPLCYIYFLDIPCTRLQSLEVWLKVKSNPHRLLHNFNINAQGGVWNFDNSLQISPQTLVPSALSLIPRSPSLLSLSFIQFDFLIRSFTPEIWSSFSQLALRSLRLEVVKPFFDSPSIATILSRCPSTLQELEISYQRVLGFYEIWTDPTARLDQVTARQVPWSPLPALRTLKITQNSAIEMPTLVLLPLLRQCSSLEELSIPHMDSDENATEFFDIILRYCRNIKALRLSNHLRPIVPGPQFPPGYPSQELFRVANIYRGLREIGMVVRPEEEYPIMPTLLFYSGGSLEVIDLGIYCTNFFPARNPFIANILQDCGRLKTFSIRNLGIGKSCISLRDLVRTNWTSNQLERLEILVIEAGYPNEDDTSNADELSLLSSDEIQEQYEEDTAMFLVQLSMKYHAQKKYIGGPPSWYEAATNLLPYETAVDRVGGVMNPVVWKRVRVAPASVPPPNNVE